MLRPVAVSLRFGATPHAPRLGTPTQRKARCFDFGYCVALKFTRGVQTHAQSRQEPVPKFQPNFKSRFVVPGKFTHELVLQMIEHFRKQGFLEPKSAAAFLDRSAKVIQSLPSLVELETSNSLPLTVIGDVHGQFYDVLNIFALNGLPSDTNRYLFNGDLVDRGFWGCEIVFVLLAFKEVYPDGVHINAGNHEVFKSMHKSYGFLSEVAKKYPQMYPDFANVLYHLPLASLVNKSTFVVHGGLPPHPVKITSLRDVPRGKADSPPDQKTKIDGVALHLVETGLLWSDPWDDPKRKYGRGIPYGPEDSKRFLKENNIEHVIRSHVCVDDGFLHHHEGRVTTLFSAPRYAGSYPNVAAFARLENPQDPPKYTQFKHVWDPYFDGQE